MNSTVGPSTSRTTCDFVFDRCEGSIGTAATCTFIFELDRETFAARAVREGVRVGHFKTALLQVFAVIEHRAG